ncbi:hypothetical protein ADK76_13110 [Streptomyces griseoflavus]|uniref:hypothetical protein n=1 Tax=Streptomyces rimosus TaxID=1927 RepID=UPI000517E909|nr:hypothetical protein [Streptomyces rimosus]KOG62191.1 hypothetical protein ADK76_13110 [Streptomyces griseoflavus]
MTISPRTYEGASECMGCLELARALVAALKVGDQSKATDCQVLIRRHPDHAALPPSHLPHNHGGDKLPGEPYPGPHPPPTPDGGPGVPNPPKGA